MLNAHKTAPAKKFFTQIQSGKFKGKKLLLPNFTTTRSTKNRVKACVFSVLRPNLAGKIFIEVFGGSGAMALEALSNGAEQAFIIEKDDKAYQIACKNAQSINLAIANAENSTLNSHCDENAHIFARQNFAPNSRVPSISCAQHFANAPAQVFNADSFELLPRLCQGRLSEFSICQSAPTPQSACQSLQMSQNAPENEIQPTRKNLQVNKNAPKHQITTQTLPAHNETPIIAYFDPPFHLRNNFADIYERIFSLIFSLKSSNLELFIIEHSSQATIPQQIGTFHQSKSKKFGNTTLTFYSKTH